MLRKLLPLALTLAAALAVAAPAGAQSYPPAGNTATASDTTVQPGQPVTFTAKTFQPGTEVTFTLFSAPVVLGTAIADSNGVATLTTTIPESTSPGTHTVEASGVGANGQPLTVSFTITVLGAAADAATIPATGSSSTVPMTQLAVGILALGGLLVLLANRRRAAQPDDVRETAGV